MSISKRELAAILHHATASLNSGSPVLFSELPSHQQELAVAAVSRLLAAEPHTPEQLHEVWAAPLIETGWSHGPLCHSSKTHPCLVPYSDLPYREQVKDMLWGTLIELFKTLEVID